MTAMRLVATSTWISIVLATMLVGASCVTVLPGTEQYLATAVGLLAAGCVTAALAAVLFRTRWRNHPIHKSEVFARCYYAFAVALTLMTGLSIV
jgi:peptidoglycan biosynthesis protein MviN/MurJ (putative lipid II flippase)